MRSLFLDLFASLSKKFDSIFCHFSVFILLLEYNVYYSQCLWWRSIEANLRCIFTPYTNYIWAHSKAIFIWSSRDEFTNAKQNKLKMMTLSAVMTKNGNFPCNKKKRGFDTYGTHWALQFNFSFFGFTYTIYEWTVNDVMNPLELF